MSQGTKAWSLFRSRSWQVCGSCPSNCYVTPALSPDWNMPLWQNAKCQSWRNMRTAASYVFKFQVLKMIMNFRRSPILIISTSNIHAGKTAFITVLKKINGFKTWWRTPPQQGSDTTGADININTQLCLCSLKWSQALREQIGLSEERVWSNFDHRTSVMLMANSHEIRDL